MKQPLSAIFVAKVTNPGRYFDLGTGMHLWVKSPERKYWIYRYTFGNRRQDMSLGVFPSISLADARKRAQEARTQVAQGVNPVSAKKDLKRLEIESSKEKLTFQEFARQCIEMKSHEWRNSKHGDQWRSTIEVYANPVIGNKMLDQITTEDILKVLKPIWINKTETASRLRGRLEWILASATARKMREGVNPAQWRGHLDTILSKPNRINRIKHYAALHFSQVPSFISSLRDKEGISALALEYTILTCARTGEVIGAKRQEIHSGIWTIPAERMKAGKEHRVPLTTRAQEILEIAKYLDPDSPYLFSKNGDALSNMAMYSLIKRMGLNITVHGFRSSFRDWVSEATNYPAELAEKALAHAIYNQVEAAYRRGDLMNKRQELMNDWQSFCNEGASNNVVSFKAA